MTGFPSRMVCAALFAASTPCAALAQPHDVRGGRPADAQGGYGRPGAHEARDSFGYVGADRGRAVGGQYPHAAGSYVREGAFGPAHGEAYGSFARAHDAVPSAEHNHTERAGISGRVGNTQRGTDSRVSTFTRSADFRAAAFRDGFHDATWQRDGWLRGHPFYAVAAGHDAWNWRAAWGFGVDRPAFGFGFGPAWGWGAGLGWGGWAWGGLALGLGVDLVAAPPILFLPPPIYLAPPPVVLSLPAVAPAPVFAPSVAGATEAPATSPVSGPPSAAGLMEAAIPPPIVVSPPPPIMAEAALPVAVFAPPRFGFAIAPPVFAFTALPPLFWTGGFLTGGTIASAFYGGGWGLWHGGWGWHAGRGARPGWHGGAVAAWHADWHGGSQAWHAGWHNAWHGDERANPRFAANWHGAPFRAGGFDRRFGGDDWRGGGFGRADRGGFAHSVFHGGGFRRAPDEHGSRNGHFY